MTLQQKLFDFAQRELSRLQDDLILRNDEGCKAFGIYDIKKQNGVFTVYKKHEFCGEFSSAKVALSYCIAERAHEYNLGIRLQNLDQHFLSATQSLNTRKSLIERCKNNQTREILYSKIQHRRQQQHELENQLEDCVKMAKYLYLRGLNNETQRIGCAASTRTSR
jgi:hypothetical protein